MPDAVPVAMTLCRPAWSASAASTWWSYNVVIPPSSNARRTS
ncbi:hypothetical protein [Mobilicoccus caccae]